MLRPVLEAAVSTSPILGREFVGLLRTRRVYWIAIFTIGGTSLVPLLFWPEDGSPTPFLNSHMAFEIYRSVFLLALFLFTPLVTSTAVTAEREKGTYELLLSSLLRPSGILMGKLLAAV